MGKLKNTMTLRDTLLQSLKGGDHLPPLIMSEKDLLHGIKELYGINVSNLERIGIDILEGIYLYEKEPDKKEISIEIIRKFLKDISLRGYEGTSLYIIRDIDLASLSAMNALLKILEDVPQHAIIMGTATKSELILETIRSRSIIVSLNAPEKSILHIDVANALDEYIGGHLPPLLILLHSLKLDRSASLALIFLYFEKAKDSIDGQNLLEFEKAVEALTLTNELPRNILDDFFLPKR